MRFKKLISLPVIVSILLTAFSLNLMASTNLQLDSFDVYSDVGDLNGDGIDEVYFFKAKEKILLIASEIAIPIPFHDASSFIVTANGAIEILPGYVDVTGFSAVDVDTLIGDFNGDGLIDLLFKSNDALISSVIAYGGLDEIPSSVFIFDSIEGTYVFNQALVVSDINSDGKDDLQITSYSNGS